MTMATEQEVSKSYRTGEAAGPDASEPDSSEPISRLYNACIAFFRNMLRSIKTADRLSKISTRRLERSFATLALWGVDFDVVHGNLDRRLKRSHSLRRLTLSLLVAIVKTLTRRMSNSNAT